MAFLHFAKQETDLNVIEVGMGGRLDATSLCKGNISLITSIDKDHTSYLGNTIQEIAFEKASIIKSGGMVFAVNENKDVVNTISKIAKNKSAKLHLLGNQFGICFSTHLSLRKIIEDPST